jgi:hypothetical protein
VSEHVGLGGFEDSTGLGELVLQDSNDLVELGPARRSGGLCRRRASKDKWD